MTERLERILDHLQSLKDRVQNEEALTSGDREVLMRLGEVALSEEGPGGLSATSGVGEARSVSRRWLRIPVAAAAAVLIGFLFGRWVGPLSPPSLSMSAEHIPDLEAMRGDDRGDRRLDAFRFWISEDRYVFVLLRCCDRATMRFNWRPHRWSDSARSPRIHIKAHDPILSPVDVTDDLAVTQFYFVCAAKDAADLPGNDEELSKFLECLEKAYRRPDGGEDLSAALEAVRSCLPPRVSTWGNVFVVRSRE